LTFSTKHVIIIGVAEIAVPVRVLGGRVGRI